VPFVCGCRNLGEALRRIDEGASMIRTKGEAGTGNVVEAVRHARAVHREIKQLCAMDEDELFMFGTCEPVTICASPSPLRAARYSCWR
jgi:pyridoxal 5'-phosphate synthase pdxS subunit